MNLEELKNQKDSYVQQEVDRIINTMIEKSWTDWKISTCDHSNWDRELHRNMPDIVYSLRKKGLKVRHDRKWGVDDWYITV